MSEPIVKSHLHRIFAKKEIHKRSQLVHALQSDGSFVADVAETAKTLPARPKEQDERD